MAINISLQKFEDLSCRADGRATQSERRISPQNWVAGFFIVDTSLLLSAGIAPIFAGREWHDFSDALTMDLGVVVGAGVALACLFSRLLDVYGESRIFDAAYGLRRICLALMITFAAILTVGVATKTSTHYPRVWFFSCLALSFAAIAGARLALLCYLQARVARGAYVYRAMSLAINAEPLSEADIRDGENALVKLVGQRNLAGPAGLADLAPLIAKYDIDRIYITVPWEKALKTLRASEYLRQFATQVYVVAGNLNGIHCISDANPLGGRVSLRVVDRPIHPWGLWMKRVQDVVVASTLLVLFAPIMLVIAAAIRLESAGPVLFRQKRVGFNGASFEIGKFRSMYATTQIRPGSRQTSRNDPRVSKVGRIIRRMSFDELPQLFNVLQGTMSVVGPRPHAKLTRRHGRQLERAAELYAARHRVKPGITGWAQINGCGGELISPEKLRERVDYDMSYIENWSTWLDVKIILRTAALIFFDRSAY
jgi:exopolysaccharide biosynthesis polyprenyl glycosylphosphotransferase